MPNDYVERSTLDNDYPDNSNKHRSLKKDSQGKPKGKLKGKIVTKKENPVMGVFKDAFQTTGHDLATYVANEAVNGVKNLVLDSLEKSFFGTSSGRLRKGFDSSRDDEDYTSYSRKRKSSSYGTSAKSRKNAYEDVYFTDEEDVNAALKELRKVAKEDDYVTVLYYCDWIGCSHKPSDDDYAWDLEALSKANKVFIRGVGWKLILPKPEMLVDD